MWPLLTPIKVVQVLRCSAAHCCGSLRSTERPPLISIAPHQPYWTCVSHVKNLLRDHWREYFIIKLPKCQLPASNCQKPQRVPVPVLLMFLSAKPPVGQWMWIENINLTPESASPIPSAPTHKILGPGQVSRCQLRLLTAGILDISCEWHGSLHR